MKKLYHVIVEQFKLYFFNYLKSLDLPGNFLGYSKDPHLPPPHYQEQVKDETSKEKQVKEYSFSESYIQES